MSTQTTPPVVVVPTDGQMAAEPARRIGDIFADKAMLKTLISGIATIVAGVTGRIIGDDQIAAWVDVIAITGVMVTLVIAQKEAGERATAQAEATRDAVFAPATVADVAKDAALSGFVEVVDGDPASMDPAQWGSPQQPEPIRGRVPGMRP